MEVMRNYTNTEGGRKYLYFEGKKYEHPDTVASGMLEYNQIYGLLPFTLLRFDTKVTARYDITSFISLSKMLENPVTKEEILLVTDAIMDVLEQSDEYLINPDSVILDTDYIFYDKTEKKVHFCIYPFITDNVIKQNVNGFLKDFICKAKFDSDENCDYIGKILGFINSGEEFSTDRLRTLLSVNREKDRAELCSDTDYVINEVKSAGNIKSENVYEETNDTLITEKDNILSFDDDLTDDDFAVTDSRKGIFSKLFWDNSRKNRNMSSDNSEDFIMNTLCDDNGEILFPDEVQETVLLKNKPVRSNASLIRKKDNHRIEITGNRFRIGTDNKLVDYCINDNNAVSRQHAVIVKKSGEYFLSDNNSTNHTYVDNRIIKGKKGVKLTNNSCIMLADEEFIFCN